MPAAAPATPAAQAAAAEGLEAVGIDADRGRALAAWLATAPPEVLAALTPSELPSDIAGDDPLDLLLAAAEVSVLTVTLRAVCGWCGAIATRLSALCDATTTFTCGPCGLDQPSRLDVSIEAVWSPTRSFRLIRASPAELHAGPRFRLHHFHPSAVGPDGPYSRQLPDRIGFLGDLSAGDRRGVAIDGSPGDILELIALPAGAAHIVVVADGPPPAPVEAGPTGFDRAEQTCGRGTLELSATGDVAVCGVWIRRGAARLQPASVTSMCPARALYLHPRARARMPALLLPSQPLGIEDVTVWFSDISGSTALYEAQGDVESWRRVEQHFQRLHRVVLEGGGAVLKTLGDAVLAAFSEPAAAVAAAAAAVESEPDLQLRVGIARGPALAVESNGQPDLFGRVLNLAARLQSHAPPGCLCMPAGFVEDEAIMAPLTGWSRSVDHVALKGIGGQVAVAILRRSG